MYRIMLVITYNYCWLQAAPLCNFRQWIDTERTQEALDFIWKSKLARVRARKTEARIKADQERRMQEHRAMQAQRRKEKEERERERERKRERARRAKAAVEAGGSQVLRKGKWPRCTQ